MVTPINHVKFFAGLAIFLLLLPGPGLSAKTPDKASFPLQIQADGTAITLQEPLISNWKDLRSLGGVLPWSANPVDGASTSGKASFEANTVVDFETRLVELHDVRLTGSEPRGAYRQALVSALGKGRLKLPLDSVLRSLPDDFQLPQQAVVGPQLNFQPPRIVVSDRPTRLMLIDGQPAPVEISPTQIEFVVNTDWDVFHDKRTGAWYILDDGHWITNNMLSSGDWLNTTELPRDFLTLQVSSEWPQVAAAMPPRKAEQRPVPITISYEPTELILIDGEAILEPIGDSGLQYVSNTDSDLFLLGNQYYYLAAGRWFRTKSFKRQWFAVKNLPAVFASIPEDHPRGRVLASVPGTRAAQLAMIEAAIPRVATVKAGAGSQLEIPYLGEPRFVEIQGTGLRRAENTPYQVIMNNNFYYLCHEGAWYSSSQPQGPWEAAREVPEAIYTIPATDPAFNVTFVKLESFDDSSGRAAYISTSGYYSYHYTGNSMVYGTGWYYPGFYNHYAYWRYPYTYGYRPWGPYGYGWGYPYYRYNYSETFNVNRREKDWEWNLDGSKRRVYNYGPQNYIGGTYRMPGSDNYKGDGR